MPSCSPRARSTVSHESRGSSRSSVRARHGKEEVPVIREPPGKNPTALRIETRYAQPLYVRRTELPQTGEVILDLEMEVQILVSGYRIQDVEERTDGPRPIARQELLVVFGKLQSECLLRVAELRERGAFPWLLRNRQERNQRLKAHASPGKT